MKKLLALAAFCVAATARAQWVPLTDTWLRLDGGTLLTSGYGTIVDETTPLTARPTLTFLGSPITCVDNAGNNATECTVSAGSSLPAVDTTSIVEGSSDPTKEIRFEVDGLTTATVRVLTPPDANITIAGANFANAWGDGVTQTFNPDGTNAGVNVGAQAGNPSARAAGDLYRDSTVVSGGLKTVDEQGTTVRLTGGYGQSPLTKAVFFEEFPTQVNGGPAAVSLNNFRCNTDGTGTGCNSPMSGTNEQQDHPGVFSCTSGTTASTASCSIGTSINQMVGGGEVFEAIVALPTATAGAGSNQDYSTFFGLCSTLDDNACVDGIGFYTTPADTGGFWHIITIDDSTSTATDVASNSAITYNSGAVGTFYRLTFVVNAAHTSVNFYVNGTELNVSPLAANIPDDGAADLMAVVAKIWNGSGTTHSSPKFHIDSIYFSKPVTR